MRLIILWIILISSAYSYELVIVQSVSKTGQTFITRNGKRNGVAEGSTATFTGENVAVLAKAIKVTGEFTQWELENQVADVPFVKDQIITYNHAEEYLWTLTPEIQKKKFIKSHIRPMRHSLILTGSLTKTLSESVSGVADASPIRGGVLSELFYEKEMSTNLAFSPGFRYEKEVVNYTEATFTSTRYMLLGDIRFYFDPMVEFFKARVYIALGMGFGQSSTETTTSTTSGRVTLLPVMKGGLNLPIDDNWEFIAQSAFESINTEETTTELEIQTTTQTNFRFGVGLKTYFR